jgi:cytochrome c553
VTTLAIHVPTEKKTGGLWTVELRIVELSGRSSRRRGQARGLAASVQCGMSGWIQRGGRVSDGGLWNNGSVTMINNHFQTVLGALAVLAVLAAPAKAAEEREHMIEAAAVASPGNIAEAQAILGAKLLVCNTCHGENGVPRSAGTPVIRGQQEAYLLKQLHDFQSGARASEVMQWMATALTPEELAQAASFLAKRNWPAPRAAAAGATAAASPASPPATIAVCQICHQQNLVGGLTAPRLAGQTYEYLVESMRRYADGERTNSADMMNLMKSISVTDREAMARYISGL